MHGFFSQTAVMDKVLDVYKVSDSFIYIPITGV